MSDPKAAGFGLPVSPEDEEILERMWAEIEDWDEVEDDLERLLEEFLRIVEGRDRGRRRWD